MFTMKNGMLINHDAVKRVKEAAAEAEESQLEAVARVQQLRPTPRPKRLGRWKMPQHLFEDELIARALYRDMIVYRADASFVDDTLMLWAEHPAFAVMEPGLVIPEYVATVHNPKGMKPRRPEDFVVQWTPKEM